MQEGHGREDDEGPLGEAAILPQDTELSLVLWIEELRRDEILVSSMMLDLKALGLADAAGIDRDS